MNSHKKILIIEDNVEISRALQEVLSDIGHDVDTAKNGKEGLDHLINRQLPDIILLDLFLPIMNGIEFRKRQLAIPYLASIPVLVMSADACIEGRSKIAHVANFLKKPFELSDLIKKLDEM